jgi:transcriptional regulator with XRE-family HTH domain
MHRKRARLSQEKLAEKAELSMAYLSEVENGKENISIDALARIANVFGLWVGDLLVRGPEQH